VNKNIAFYIRKISADEGIFASRELYFISYQQFYLAMQRLGADVRFVSPDDEYMGNGTFASSCVINGITEVADFTDAGEFTADIVFNKGNFEATDIKVVTDQRLQILLTNKAEMYRLFPQFQPLTLSCSSIEEVRAAAQQIKTNKIVIKEFIGSGGKEVHIIDHDTIGEFESDVFPLLVQEFLDTSGGIPGLVSGVHDMRVLITGGEIVGATIRQPAEGRLHSNVSQGGTEMIFPADSIPSALTEIVKYIDALIPDYPRYYSADFGLTQNGWKLFELNDKPGLFRESDGESARDIMEKVATYILGVSS